MFHRLVVSAIAALAAVGVTAAAAGSRRQDVAAHLYIVESSTASGAPGQVAVFPLSARGNVAPEYTIGGPHTMLTAPYALAFDANGDTFVYNSGYASGTCDRVVEFAPGASGDATPIREIDGNATGFCGGGGYNFAVTPHGEVYVPVQSFNYIVVFSAHQHGNVPPERVLTYVQSLASIDFDAHGNLWNAQITYKNAVDEYSPAGKHIAEITEPGQVYLFTIARDTLYAPAERQNVVTITNLRNMKTKYTFQYPRHSYWSVSVDAGGNMYYFYYPPRHQDAGPEIEIYAPGGSNPIGTLGGSLTGLTYGVGGSARVGP